jgi:nucleoside-diphosphate-sugar epimerase
MRKPVVLITGADGEIGNALVSRLAADGLPIITLDIHRLNLSAASHSPRERQGIPLLREFTGSVTDAALLDRILAEFEVDLVFHLAALLSTRAEFTPATAHHVNVEGTLNLLEFAQRQGESHGRPVVMVYPSSIAAYGLPGRSTKEQAGPVREGEWAHPITMYGCNKLYCEELGRYYARHYKQLSVGVEPRVDFRAVRFPGIMSATTTPSGGTSDYASEMIHAAARGEPYACFVDPDTTIPFMAMPDVSSVLMRLATTPRERLTHTTYNVSAFSVSAAEIRDEVLAAFPQAEITYKIDRKRQEIVDSWPADVDVTAARADWGFQPAYDRERAFHEYLIPTIRNHYTL